MKLLIVGANYSYSIERFFIKYITEKSKETYLFPAQNKLNTYLNDSIINKVYHKLGLSKIYDDINSELILYIEETKPDWIWIFKGMQVKPETLKWAKSKGIKLANYNPDNPFIFTGSGSGNKYVSESIGLYDIHFTYSLDIMHMLEKYNIPTYMLPFGFDLDGMNPNYDFEEIVAPCFLGNPDKDRASFIKELNKRGVKMHLYGHNWDKFVSGTDNQIFSPAYEENFWRTLKSYRVQINMMRVHNLKSHNMRTFEIPAVGGIQLAPYSEEHAMFFDEGKEIFLYSNVNECADKINHILHLNKVEGDNIRASAMEKSIRAGYDYKSRALFALSKFI